MGIILSLRRLSGWKTEEDEAESQRSISLNLTRPFSSLYERLYCTLKEIWRKICSFPISLYNCLKGVLFHRIDPRKTAGPLLPLENPTPKLSDNHPLKQALLISNSNADLQRQNIHFFSGQGLEQNQGYYSSETKNTKDSVKISIPSFSTHVLDFYGTRSITDTDSAVITRENAPRKNVSYAKHEQTGKYISTDKMFEDQCLEQNQKYPSQVKNIVDSLTIYIPNFRDYRALDYSASSSKDTYSAAIIQENAARKNVSYPKHEERGICISTKKKCKESSKEKEIEGKKVIESKVVVEKARWIRHYSSRHRILLVGEGDFSFSCSLALNFGCASKMVATSLDSKAFLKKNYAKAPWNIGELKKRGGIVMHGIDATTIATQQLLQHSTFDRIIYNFPYAGFFKGLSRDSTLRRHRRLVSLFLKNAKEMIDENGEIHISHKTNEYHNEWNLVSMASSHGLRLIEEVEFDLSDYPGYNTKRGFGGDSNFNCYPSNTYKFGLKFAGY